MKKYKLASLITFPIAATTTIIPLSSCTLNNNNNNNVKKDSIKPHDQKASSIFNLKDGVLYGFKEGITQQELLDNMEDNTLVLPECNEIAEGAFRDTILNDAPFGTTITIPSTTTVINDFAFYGNAAASVTWEGTPSCTTIGKSAFGRCKKLTTFKIPASVTTIKGSAFMGCSTLATIDCTALSSCPTLGNKSVFRGTPSSGSLTLTDANAEIIWSGFVGSGLNISWEQKNSSGGTISKPKIIPTNFLTYETVNDNEGNATLTITGVNTSVCDITKFNKLSIPATIDGVNVTTIADGAFKDVTSLKTVDLSNATNLTQIGTSTTGALSAINGPFQGCTALTSVTLPKNLLTINDKAFNGATSLTAVTIPTGSKLITVGRNAFDGDTKLSTFAFENTQLKSLLADCFRNTGFTSVTLPSTVKVMSAGVFNAISTLTTVNLANVTTTNVKMPNYLFYNCSSLTTVTLPSNWTTVAIFAFYQCTSLKKITIPASVTKIPGANPDASGYEYQHPFYGCTALEQVIFSDTTKKYTVKSHSGTSPSTISTSYAATNAATNATYLKNGYLITKNS